ncbi:hypothetical protein B5P44_00865 [Mycobacterium sp. CBMA 213]|nr:hypothetical protein [Mycolicibacterium sp. CBMA 213]
MCVIVPFSPNSGHRTLKLVGLIHREHAKFTDKYVAAAHKVDVEKLQLIAERHLSGKPGPGQLAVMIDVVAQRGQGRWRWFRDHRS